MKIDLYEKAYLAVSGVLLVFCLAALLYAATVRGIHLPTHVAEVDPHRLAQTPPFDRPGVRQTGPNQYEAVIVGRAWVFDPAVIEVPAGAEVTFTATSADVIHGFNIATTRVNMMLIPGQVTRMVYRFRSPGEYLLICHEFCGIGHHTMAGKVVVR
ncbi:MAG TPA: cytochrome c oxidase subunit II [Longimicrobiales bacterium]